MTNEQRERKIKTASIQAYLKPEDKRRFAEAVAREGRNSEGTGMGPKLTELAIQWLDQVEKGEN